MSVDSSGSQADDYSETYDEHCATSADGKLVVFSSGATNLVAGDTNATTDVFARDRCDALWENYGDGHPGTNGVPTFTSRTDPVLGTTVTLDLANSSGSAAVGLLFVGFQRTTIHSNWGGDLLVAPSRTILVSIPAGGASFSGAIPDNDNLCGIAIDLQALESDSGATKGVSFTPGLELVLGR